MPKNLIRKFIPTPETIRQHPSLRFLGSLLHSPGLWHLNRQSASGAFAIGLFCMWIPVPFQMLLAAILAISTSVNLPLSVALVWITNPLTMAPMFYAAYLLGAWLLDREPIPIEFEVSISWLNTTLLEIWQPFLLGCTLLALVSAVLGFVLVRLIWRCYILRRLYKKRRRGLPG